MSEKEAWLMIWNAYNTSRSERNRKQDSMARFGICNALWHTDVDVDTLHIMSEKVDAALPEDSAYLCEYNEEGDKFRADYCFHQASLL